MTIRTLLSELQSAYVDNGYTHNAGLLPPATKTEIDAITTALKFPVPKQLREVLKIHGGQRSLSKGGTEGLFGSHRLHTPAQVIRNHKMFFEHCLLDPVPDYPPAKGEQGYWVPELLPFASWDSYNLCVHCITGDVWDFDPHRGLMRPRKNIAAVLSEFLEALRAGKEPEMAW